MRSSSRSKKAIVPCVKAGSNHSPENKDPARMDDDDEIYKGSLLLLLLYMEI